MLNVLHLDEPFEGDAADARVESLLEAEEVEQVLGVLWGLIGSSSTVSNAGIDGSRDFLRGQILNQINQ